MTFHERINQGSRQSHARNSFSALAVVSCAATDALRKSYLIGMVYTHGYDGASMAITCSRTSMNKLASLHRTCEVTNVEKGGEIESQNGARGDSTENPGRRDDRGPVSGSPRGPLPRPEERPSGDRLVRFHSNSSICRNIEAVTRRAIIEIDAAHSCTAFGYLTFGNSQILGKCLDSEFIANGLEALESKRSLVLSRFWNLAILLIQCFPECAQTKISYFPEVLEFVGDFCVLRLVKVILTESEQVAPFHFWLKTCNFVDLLAQRFAEGEERKRDFYELLLPCCHNRVLREEIVKPSVLEKIMRDDSVYKFDLLAPFVSRSSSRFFVDMFDEAFRWMSPLESDFGQARLGVLKFVMRLVRLSDKVGEDHCKRLIDLILETMDKFQNHSLLIKAVTVFVTEMVTEGVHRDLFLEHVMPVLIRSIETPQNIVLYAWAMNALSDIDTAAKENSDLMMDLSSVASYDQKCKDLILAHKRAILKPYGGPVVPVNHPPESLDLFEPVPLTIDK